MVDANGRPARRATARCRTASNPPSHEQLGGGADQRIPPAFSFGSDAPHTLLGSGTAADELAMPRAVTHMVPAKVVHIADSDNPFRVAQQTERHWRRFMMARMPDMSRRAVLRLGAGAAAGAVGAYATRHAVAARSTSSVASRCR